MPKSVQAPLPVMEVNRVDDLIERRDRTTNEVDRLHAATVRGTLAMASAKAKVGAAVRRAIHDAPLKAFGDKGTLSKVIAGEKVPDYLGRIAQDKGARRRFALALLEDDSDVVVTTTIQIAHDKKVG